MEYPARGEPDAEREGGNRITTGIMASLALPESMGEYLLRNRRRYEQNRKT